MDVSELKQKLLVLFFSPNLPLFPLPSLLGDLVFSRVQLFVVLRIKLNLNSQLFLKSHVNRCAFIFSFIN